ncbi:MAG: transporter substrate-binding protein [Paenibacillus sp.]|jgi:putative aldouronate transport system substrate-binding protein|nr:transporter substrate-binding protein [Paenibacillus sp.]
MALTAVVFLAGCAGSREPQQGAETTPVNPTLKVTIATPQVGEAPKRDTLIQLAIERYTHTKLEIQWIPAAAFENKKNIMMAAGEMPKALKLTYNAATLQAIQSGLFWEIGPLLKDYKHLSAAAAIHYDNIKVNGKLYGLPLYRDIGRGGIIYRKDWFGVLGLHNPVTLDDWYNLMKTVAHGDPDKNGQQDTYGLLLDQSYNDPASSTAFLTRIAVTQGAPNKWGMESGKLIPEFMTKPYWDTMRLLRRLYHEKLINADFAVVQALVSDSKWRSGKAAIRINNATSAASSYHSLAKLVPEAAVDVMPFTGPAGRRLPAESGNNGFYVFPKSSVTTEAELKQLLGFFNKLLEPEMSTLLTRGIEGRHYVKTEDGMAKLKDLSLFQSEVKPYRDSLPSFEVNGTGLPLKFNGLQEKGWSISADNVKYAVPNLALSLTSQEYINKGTELDILIRDAQTKYIMGKLDDEGWMEELDRWKKDGGDKVIEEFTADYFKQNKLNK